MILEETFRKVKLLHMNPTFQGFGAVCSQTLWKVVPICTLNGCVWTRALSLEVTPRDMLGVSTWSRAPCMNLPSYDPATMRTHCYCGLCLLGFGVTCYRNMPDMLLPRGLGNWRPRGLCKPDACPLAYLPPLRGLSSHLPSQ